MNRNVSSYAFDNFNTVKLQVLNWLNRFSIFCFLDSHEYPTTSGFECLAGAGVINGLSVTSDSFAHLETFVKQNPDWIFGHLNYDLKNQIEKLTSANPDHIGFPDLFFFVPQIVLLLTRSHLTIASVNAGNDEIYSLITSASPKEFKGPPGFKLKERFSKEDYISTIHQLQGHIARGNCYEINFCQEFYAEKVECDPVNIFNKLSEISANPFSCLYRVNDAWLMCASPERYLQKSGNLIKSQPIKGTASRKAGEEDDYLKEKLRSSEKERAENVMIVDLVRNDLSKICVEGSVKVEELFGLYSFPQVHQMISTITGILKGAADYENIFKATFPMGSMTGAPKKRVMELIEEYERTGRGIFSGAVGYFSPAGNFDFNVVIRSIMYNAESKYLSIQAGSAITAKSIAKEEYQECLLKVAGLKKALNL